MWKQINQSNQTQNQDGDCVIITEFQIGVNDKLQNLFPEWDQICL
ncbi:hypothetical protein pb186bvf_018534 [Paramecium bursaria]